MVTPLGDPLGDLAGELADTLGEILFAGEVVVQCEAKDEGGFLRLLVVLMVLFLAP